MLAGKKEREGGEEGKESSQIFNERLSQLKHFTQRIVNQRGIDHHGSSRDWFVTRETLHSLLVLIQSQSRRDCCSLYFRFGK